MTPFREAIVVPLIFLTVVAAGALRPGSEAVFAPASPAALIVAMALVALLVRSGALAPERLMNSDRAMLANINGCLVLLTGFVASAQVIATVVPESGVPAVIVWTVLLSLPLQAFAIGPDRRRLLRGLLVTFGAAFALKYIVLAALSAPAQGRVARALQTLFDGFTLGAVTQRPTHEVEAYLALAATVLYFIGLALLPAAPWHMVRVSRYEPAHGYLPPPDTHGRIDRAS